MANDCTQQEADVTAAMADLAEAENTLAQDKITQNAIIANANHDLQATGQVMQAHQQAGDLSPSDIAQFNQQIAQYNQAKDKAQAILNADKKGVADAKDALDQAQADLDACQGEGAINSIADVNISIAPGDPFDALVAVTGSPSRFSISGGLPSCAHLRTVISNEPLQAFITGKVPSTASSASYTATIYAYFDNNTQSSGQVAIEVVDNTVVDNTTDSSTIYQDPAQSETGELTQFKITGRYSDPGGLRYWFRDVTYNLVTGQILSITNVRGPLTFDEAFPHGIPPVPGAAWLDQVPV